MDKRKQSLKLRRERSLKQNQKKMKYRVLEEGLTIGENVYSEGDEVELTIEDAEKNKETVEEIKEPEEVGV